MREHRLAAQHWQRRLRRVAAHARAALRQLLQFRRQLRRFALTSRHVRRADAAPQTITEFCRAHPHEFKVVYVSVDVDERWYKAGVQGKVSAACRGPPERY